MKEHFVKTLADGQTENYQRLKEITTHSVLTSLITLQTITKNSGQEFRELNTDAWKSFNAVSTIHTSIILSILKFNYSVRAVLRIFLQPTNHFLTIHSQNHMYNKLLTAYFNSTLKRVNIVKRLHKYNIIFVLGS